MNRKRSFGYLLVTYTILLLLPVVAIGLLLIFFCLGKLEKNFEELNTKTIEAACTRLDMQIEDVLAIDYQLSLNPEVHTFLTREFSENRERVLLLQEVREAIQDVLVNRDGVSAVAIYSRVNDLFVGNPAAFDLQGLYERYFSRSEWEPEELSAALANVGATSVWLDAGDYLVYCSGIMTAGRSGSGRLLVMVSKQILLKTWVEVFGSLESECAIAYRDGSILLRTDGFEEAAFNPDFRSLGILLKKYDSQKAGNLSYLYTCDKEHFKGNIARMTRNLLLISFTLILLGVALAGRKALRIRDMYTEALVETTTLEDQLNSQVEELNRQLLRNALRGFEPLPLEKLRCCLRGSRIRVLIFRPSEGEQTEEQGNNLLSAAEKSLEAENISLWPLYDTDMGCVCVIGYDSDDKARMALEHLRAVLERICRATIHMGVSTETVNIGKLSEDYERAAAALHYCRILRESGGIVDYGEILELEKEKIYYPPEREQQLLRSVRMGLLEDASECLERIYQVNFRERHLSRSAERKLLLKMINTGDMLAETLWENEPERQEAFDRLSRTVLMSGGGSGAFDILRDSFLALCKSCVGQKDGELRKRISVYIGEHFREQDLSLELMAEDFGISYYHLSRLFNECMQMSFTAYLAGLRLEYAKMLLCSTECNVEQIAQQAGFLQSGSFIRAFKKYYGVTPGKYREEQRKTQ